MTKYRIRIGAGYWDGAGIVYGTGKPEADIVRLSLPAARELIREWNRINRLIQNRGRHNAGRVRLEKV